MGIFSAFSGLISDISEGFGGLFDSGRTANIDGASMNGNGNAFDTTEFESSPMVNIDGTPMMGDVDINGNTYGITESDVGADSFLSSPPSFDDSFLGTTMDTESSLTMDDSFLSGCGADDTFGSDSMFDNDTFSSSWDD